jgi:hypothetical protein
VDVLAGEAEVVTVGNDLPVVLVVAGLRDLAPLLRGVVFIGEAALERKELSVMTG